MSSPHLPDPAAGTGLDLRRKRARFRAWHRGTRELDLVMGRFADREIASLSEEEFELFERLLEEPDPAVYDWISGREPVPQAHDTPLFARLREHGR